MADLKLNISSPAIDPTGPVPKKYTCDGENISPPLRVDDIPEAAKSLTIIVEDPDAPNGTFTHWMVWNLPPRNNIAENELPAESAVGVNDFGKYSYGGPCPPKGEEHRYIFKVYALDSKVDLEPKGATRGGLEILLKEKTIAYGELLALYKRS